MLMSVTSAVRGESNGSADATAGSGYDGELILQGVHDLGVSVSYEVSCC